MHSVRMSAVTGEQGAHTMHAAVNVTPGAAPSP